MVLQARTETVDVSRLGHKVYCGRDRCSTVLGWLCDSSFKRAETFDVIDIPRGGVVLHLRCYRCTFVNDLRLTPTGAYA